jgi:hypothetical protein
MNLQMKSNVQNHRSASRGKSQQARRSAGNCEESISSKIEPGLSRAIERSFVEDFNQEHSLLCASIMQKTISAGSDLVAHSTPEKTYAFDLGSPNCVYLG